MRGLLAATEEEAVRVAAIEALGSLGGTEDLDLLLKSLSNGSQLVRDAARASFRRRASAGV